LKSLVVIPTFNEAANIASIISTVVALDDLLDVLVVDDDSPDGTSRIVETMATLMPARLFLLKRAGKQGLGSAYIAGFQWGLSRGYEAIFEMDADFSHDPRIIPLMLAELKHCDVTVGSRYIEGGGTSNWNWFRLLVSRSGSMYSRFVLRMGLHDCTGGFNGWKRHVLEGIDLPSIKSEGYSFQVELKFRAWKRGFKIVEVPIVFSERRAGKSKMSGRIFLEAIYRIWQIRSFK